MADSKISNLNELATAPDAGDLFVIVDVSDTSMSASGTTKKIQSSNVTISDASTTVKGKVELATDAEAATSTDTVRALTPSNGQSIVAGATVAAAGKTTPVDADSFPLVDSAASNVLKELTWANVKATLLTYFNTLFPGKDGWQSVSDSWTYASADAPTFTITVPSGAASLYGVGDRIKLTQTTVKYFIVTAVADTVLTVYGGTDYTLANAAISAISYSHMKAPIGFPLDPTKWTVQTTNTATTTQSSPTQNVWYNINSINIIIPIGLWNAGYECSSRPIYNSNAPNQYTTLSTANNSESDSEFTSRLEIGGTAANLNALVGRYKILSLAAKTTYYLNHKTDNSTQTSLSVTSTSPFPRTVVKAVCAYL